MASLNVLDDSTTKTKTISKHRDECSDATAFGRFIEQGEGGHRPIRSAVLPVENGEARAHVVCVSDQFFGWVAA